MPDADIIHTKLPRNYNKVYKQICEWNWNEEYIGEEALKSLVKGIKHYGNEPLEFISAGLSQFEEFASVPLFIPTIKWLDEKKKIYLLRQHYMGNKRGLDIAMDTLKEKLQDFRLGVINSDFLDITLFKNYISKIYKADFEDVIFQMPEHYLDIPPEIVRLRVLEIKPIVEEGIDKLAVQIVNGKKLNSLKYKPSKSLKKKISLEDNIFEL